MRDTDMKRGPRGFSKIGTIDSCFDLFWKTMYYISWCYVVGMAYAIYRRDKNLSNPRRSDEGNVRCREEA